MEVKYLTILKDHPEIGGPTGLVKKLVGLTEAEIADLENHYNNGNPFPQALNELLFLAGKYCYVLDYGRKQTQTILQDFGRRQLIRRNRNIPHNRPFFVIDIYNPNEQFLFVYLDEAQDPTVYELILYNLSPSEGHWLHSVGGTLSQYIESCTKDLLRGYNPF
jgi:hypothetical protein